MRCGNYSLRIIGNGSCAFMQQVLLYLTFPNYNSTYLVLFLVKHLENVLNKSAIKYNVPTCRCITIVDTLPAELPIERFCSHIGARRFFFIILCMVLLAGYLQCTIKKNDFNFL